VYLKEAEFNTVSPPSPLQAGIHIITTVLQRNNIFGTETVLLISVKNTGLDQLYLYETGINVILVAICFRNQAKVNENSCFS
jgi:hypothetical protein